MTRPLHLVASDEPLDITLAMRAEIKARDWSAVHVAGDRRPPIHLPEQRRRGWLR